MRKDMTAQVTIRGLDKMTKAEVRSVAAWMNTKARVLRVITSQGKPWLVDRKDYAGLFNFSLMK